MNRTWTCRRLLAPATMRPRLELLGLGAILPALLVTACGGVTGGGPGAGGGAVADSGSAPTNGHALSVVLDGQLEEWVAVPPLVEDDLDPTDGPAIDLDRLAAADDPAWLFLRLQVGRAMNLQAMAGTVTLLVDADGDPATGGSVDGMTGVEFAVDLSPRPDPANQEYGAGFALRLPDGSTPTPYDVGVASLPTYAADDFEMRLLRSPRGDLPPLGPVVRLGVVARADASDTTAAPGTTEIVDRLRATAYRFATARGADPFQPELDLLAPPPPGAFRVATWNVGSEGFRRVDGFAAILARAGPDIVLLDEVYGDVTPSDLEAFFAHPAMAELGEWAFALSLGGGRQKTVVAARNRGLRQEPSMAEVAYAPGVMQALRLQVPERFHDALALEERINMSATGAWVEVDPEGAPGREVLFVPVDLQSAGWEGSPQDVLRLLQAQTLVRHMRQATSGAATGDHPPAVVLAGDLNLVGGRSPLDTLLADRRNPYGPLVAAELPRLDEASWATWQSERQALFGPGRLDFTLYAAESMEQIGGFVLGTSGLSDEELGALGLTREQAHEAAEDHFPLIVDLRLRHR